MKKIAILFILAVVALGTGCTKQGVTNLHNMVHGNQSIAVVETCIINGARNAGWEIERSGARAFDAIYKTKDRLEYDSKALIVEIVYNNDSYFIGFKRGVQTGYNEDLNTIHKDANKWMRGLDASIQKELVQAELEVRKQTGRHDSWSY